MTSEECSGGEVPVETRGASRPWRPAPAIKASALLHVGAAAGAVLRPDLWPWALAAIAGNHLVLTAAGLWPRSRLIGHNIVYLPEAAARRSEIALTFDDGPDPDVTPRVLELLDGCNAKASFFCVGERAARYPDVVREIARRGHAIENHSYRHAHSFAFFGMGRLRADIEAAQNAINDITGHPPAFFRAPAGVRSPLLDPVLARLGLRYASWTRRGFDAVERESNKVLLRLTRGLAAGDILLMHDGGCARTSTGQPVVLQVLPYLLERLNRAKLKSVPLTQACGEAV